MFQVPVVQTSQEHLVGGVGDNAVGFILAFRDEGELAVDDAGVVSGESVNGNNDLKYQIIALLSEIEVIPAVVLVYLLASPSLAKIRSKHTSWDRPSTIHESAILALSERAATLSAS